MSQELNQDELNALADLLVISQKAKAREALCIKIGISYYKELGFIYESSDYSFAINLINHLNDVGNTKAICHLCCKELSYIFHGERESFLKEVAVKLNCNQELRHNYSNSSIVEKPTSSTSSPVPEFGINPPLPPDRSKPESWFTKISNVNKKLLRNGVIIIMGGLVAVYGLYKSFSNSNISPSDLAGNSPGYIVSSLSDSSSNSLCLSTKNGNSLNYTPVILWDCNRNSSRTDQTWEFIDGGLIRNTLSGRCIDVPGSPGKDNGARLQLYDCESSGFNRDNGLPTDQRWEIIDGEFIRNTLSGKCIDVDGSPGNGTQLQLYDCKSSGFNRDNGLPTGQRWRLGTSK